MTRRSCTLALLSIAAIVSVAKDTARAQEKSPSTTAPGDEAMRPTEHGLHLTPRLAEAFALHFVRHELAVPLDLSEDQEHRLSQAIGNSMIAAARSDSKASQEFVQRMLAMMLESQGNQQ